MKKALVLAILAALLAGSGCAEGAGKPDVTESPLLEEKFWEIDIGKAEYNKIIVSHGFSWQKNGVLVNLSVSPCGYGNKDPRPDAQTVTENGREYTINDSYMDVDPAEGTGFTSHIREMRWSDGSHDYLLYAQTGGNNNLSDIVSTKTAGQIERNDYSVFAGLELSGEGYLMRLNSGDKEIDMQVIPSPHDKEFMQSIVTEGGMVLHEGNGFEYYLYEKERTSEDINIGRILWNTDKGLVVFSAGISYIHRNDISAEVWDFIDPSFACSITEQLGAKILPLP